MWPASDFQSEAVFLSLVKLLRNQIIISASLLTTHAAQYVNSTWINFDLEIFLILPNLNLGKPRKFRK